MAIEKRPAVQNHSTEDASMHDLKQPACHQGVLLKVQATEWESLRRLLMCRLV